MPRNPEGSPSPRPERKTRAEYGPIPDVLSTRSLVERWNAMKPWEQPKKFSRKRGNQTHIVRPGRKDTDDIIIARGTERDTRGWVLQQLGFSDDKINNPPMDYLVAQELIAEGIRTENPMNGQPSEPLSSYHVALLDKATRDKTGDALNTTFSGVLADPEFIGPSVTHLEMYSQTIETITKPEWERIAANNNKWRASKNHQLIEDLRSEKDLGRIPHIMAVHDVAKKEISKHAFPPEKRVDMLMLPVELGAIIHIVTEQDSYSRESIAKTEEIGRVALSILRKAKMDEGTEFDEIVKHLQGRNTE